MGFLKYFSAFFLIFSSIVAEAGPSIRVGSVVYVRFREIEIKDEEPVRGIGRVEEVYRGGTGKHYRVVMNSGNLDCARQLPNGSVQNVSEREIMVRKRSRQYRPGQTIYISNLAELKATGFIDPEAFPKPGRTALAVVEDTFVTKRPGWDGTVLLLAKILEVDGKPYPNQDRTYVFFDSEVSKVYRPRRERLAELLPGREAGSLDGAAALNHSIAPDPAGHQLPPVRIPSPSRLEQNADRI